MTIDEVIEELDGLRFILERKRDRERADTGVFRASSSRVVAINAAIALLRTHPDAQPNEPLTEEELREMDGKPVWLNTLHEWFLFDATNEPFLLWSVRGVCYSAVGLVGELYRRPPKEA